LTQLKAARALSEKIAVVPKGWIVSETVQFIAMPFDQAQEGLVAGAFFKCKSPESAIDRAKGLWQVFGHAGSVAVARVGYPDAQITVLRKFGSVPDDLSVSFRKE
jgi:hypothetical protein